MAGKETRLRILMFPWLGHGHVSPFIELAKKLSSRNLHIYFCSTPVILDSIRQNRQNKDSSDDDLPFELVQLHLPSSTELPPHLHTAKNLPPHLEPTIKKAFNASSSAFADILSHIKPDLLIYDTCQPWAAKIAASQGIPRVFFVTANASATAFFHHIHIHKSFDTFPFEHIKLRNHEKRDLIAQFRTRTAIKDVGGQGFEPRAIYELSCEIALVKCSRALESRYMDYLCTSWDRKIVPTGPLVTLPDNQEIPHGSDEIMNWLSQKSQLSSLYISFGSENYFSEEQIREIAKGLELSNVNFIWVFQTPAGSDIVVEEALPEGFLDRMKERGIIVKKWVPQIAILAHPNVGGFMSHCGWSSVTESLYLGVPVVALPLKTDQPLNARLLVEVRAGVEVVTDENGHFSGEGVAKAINEVTGGESGEGFRSRARELGKKMKMEEEKDLDEVVEELSRICLKK